MKKLNIILILALCLLNLSAQEEQEEIEKIGANSWQEYLKQSEESVFRDAIWNPVGPYSIGGHIERLTSIPGNTDVIFAISSWNSVAVWKTTDGGYTWKPVLEKSAEHFGDIAIAASNPDIVWVGSGAEPWPQHQNRVGDGIFKSTDCGETWTNMGLKQLPNIVGIAIHETNPDIVYATGTGFRSAPALTGIFKTVDGGNTWNQVYVADSLQGVDELFMNAGNNEELYAFSKKRGKDRPAKIIKTANGGKDWKEIMIGLPDSENINDIGMDVSQSDPNVLYALIKHTVPAPDTTKKDDQKIDIFRSSDRGETWEKSGAQEIDFGYMVIKVAPDNPDEIYLGSVHVWHSADRGKTLKRLAENIFHIYPNPGTFMHLDQMDLWIDPVDPDKLILGNDGGVYKSKDKGVNWLHMNSFSMGEFYYIATNKEEPVMVYGGNQDNSSAYGPGDVNLLAGFPDHWEYVRMDQWSGGDGFFTHPVPGMEDWFYFSYQFGSIVRKNVKTNEAKGITPKLNGEKIKTAWHTPVLVSEYNPAILLYGGHHIMRSVNRGDSWSCISNDLTVSDNEKKKGGTVSALEESLAYEGLLYAGTSNGLVWVTRNGSGEWEDISEGLPKGIISSIEPSRFDSSRVYVSVSARRSGDFNTYLYASEDYGKTWKSITSNIYYDPANKIIEDTKDKNVLYTGTDKGVYVSLDTGNYWHSLCNNLPSCAVNDMVIHEKADMLIAATYGRGIYSADISCFREYTSESVDQKKSCLFEIRPAKEIFVKPNRMRKAVFSYYLEDEPRKEITLDILNQKDSVLYTIEPDAHQGFNQVTWDLRLADPVIDSKYYNILGKFLRKGEYKVRLNEGRKEIAVKDFIVEKYIEEAGKEESDE